MEDGETKYMQNSLDDENNGFEDFYQYEGQYTEFQRITPGSDLFNQFAGYKPEIEYELGREFSMLYPLEFAQQDYSDKTQYKVVYSIGRAEARNTVG